MRQRSNLTQPRRQTMKVWEAEGGSGSCNETLWWHKHRDSIEWNHWISVDLCPGQHSTTSPKLRLIVTWEGLAFEALKRQAADNLQCPSWSKTQEHKWHSERAGTKTNSWWQPTSLKSNQDPAMKTLQHPSSSWSNRPLLDYLWISYRGRPTMHSSTERETKKWGSISSWAVTGHTIRPWRQVVKAAAGPPARL
jgi:hypothetical protein